MRVILIFLPRELIDVYAMSIHSFLRSFKYDVSRRKSKSDKKINKPGLEEEGDDNLGELDLDAQDSMSLSTKSSVHSRKSTEGPEVSPTNDKSSKRFVTDAVLKAKTVWTALMRPGRNKRLSVQSFRVRRKASDISNSGSPKCLSTPSLNHKVRPPDPTPRTASLQGAVTQITEDDLAESEKGVYDSSTKRRVPSW